MLRKTTREDVGGRRGTGCPITAKPSPRVRFPPSPPVTARSPSSTPGPFVSRHEREETVSGTEEQEGLEPLSEPPTHEQVQLWQRSGTRTDPPRSWPLGLRKFARVGALGDRSLVSTIRISASPPVPTNATPAHRRFRSLALLQLARLGTAPKPPGRPGQFPVHPRGPVRSTPHQPRARPG